MSNTKNVNRLNFTVELSDAQLEALKFLTREEGDSAADYVQWAVTSTLHSALENLEDTKHPAKRDRLVAALS